MARIPIKQLVRACVPGPLRQQVARFALPFANRSLEVVTTLEELDRRIATADALGTESHDAYLGVLRSFEFRTPIAFPDSPESAEYQAAVMSAYRFVSGRADYTPFANEQSELDVVEATAHPYPYGTSSPTAVGEQLMAIGLLIRAMDITSGARVLEFGPGWGNATLALAQMGADVTAVDVSKDFLDVIARRARQLGANVTCVCCDMIHYEPDAAFDYVVFFESFHHCAAPLALLDRLDQLVAPGGSVVFAGEPITDTFPQPWGLRPDGLATYSIRKFGWMELGFQSRFFEQALRKRGWSLTEFDSWDVAWNRVLVARREPAAG